MSADHLRYTKRGNRYEGTVELPIAGAPALEVLSFLRGRRSIAPMPNGEITLRFYLPPNAVSVVNVESRELVADRFYEMRPVRTKWDPGWNAFSPWPVRDVLQPLGVRLDNLGVLASSPTTSTAYRELVPVDPAGSASADSRGSYYFYFRTRYDLRKADWSVRAASASSDLRHGTLRATSGGAPAVIQFDLGDAPDGYYHLYIDCRYEGQSGGPEGEYRFYHRAMLPGPGGGSR